MVKSVFAFFRKILVDKNKHRKNITNYTYIKGDFNDIMLKYKINMP